MPPQQRQANSSHAKIKTSIKKINNDGMVLPKDRANSKKYASVDESSHQYLLGQENANSLSRNKPDYQRSPGRLFSGLS